MTNEWISITQSHWVNPAIGYVKCISSNCWEIGPKQHLGSSKTFKTFEECVKHGEDLYANYKQIQRLL